jgi:hypothetical protein
MAPSAALRAVLPATAPVTRAGEATAAPASAARWRSWISDGGAGPSVRLTELIINLAARDEDVSIPNSTVECGCETVQETANLCQVEVRTVVCPVATSCGSLPKKIVEWTACEDVRAQSTQV